MLDRAGVTVREERHARKEPLDDKGARALVRSVSEVVVAKGRKSEAHAAKDVGIDMLKGPTGNYRAPMLVRGKKMLVGFSAETLESWFA